MSLKTNDTVVVLKERTTLFINNLFGKITITLENLSKYRITFRHNDRKLRVTHNNKNRRGSLKPKTKIHEKIK